ncbi:hypothetical protein AB0C76_39700 [Kitasatospora sp. NPDC048722]|uniref:hypothetical protein n=1 Tax=Kitasatospora sp. NPDC048722 TaxID=3155639 RepID=UPI0033E2A583
MQVDLRSRSASALRAALALTATAVVVAGCSSGGGSDASSATGTQASPAPSTEPQTSGGLSPTAESSGSGTPSTVIASPAGEVWEWALGRNVFTDPLFRPYLDDLTGSGIHEFSRGWEATVHSDGTVVAVNIYNDEASIGLGQSSTSYSAYTGRLPGGLLWSDTAAEAGQKLGAPAATGLAPGGSEADWTGVEGQYTIHVYFSHDALHNIIISRSSNSTP